MSSRHPLTLAPVTLNLVFPQVAHSRTIMVCGYTHSGRDDTLAVTNTDAVGHRDILYELASVGDLPLPQTSPAPSQKRERDSDSPLIPPSSTFPLHSELLVGTDEQPRTWINSRRLSKDGPSLAASTFAQPLRPKSALPPPEEPSPGASTPASSGSGSGVAPYALPLHTEELGRMPLHPGFSATYASDWRQPQQQQQQRQPAHAQAQAQQQVSAHMSAMSPPAQDGTPFDPRMMSMYALQASGFSEMFGSESSPFAAVHAMHPGARGGGSAAAAGGGAAGGLPVMTSEELAYADNTLTMWSSAPSSLE